IALQETRWPNEGILSKNNYAMFYGGGKGGALGSGFLINKRILQAVTDVQFVSDRLSYIILKNSTYKQAIINVHCPTETTDKNEIDNIKDLYYETVEQVYDRFSSYDAKIVLGDFNAKIGKESIFRPTIGTESLHDFSNDNGTRLISFATSKNLLIKRTYFKYRNIHKMTWKHPDGHTYNQIDHVLIDKRHHTNILDIRSYRGADVHSDHFLVVAKLRFRLAINKNTNVVAPSVRFDIEKLKNDVRQVTGYQLAISNRFKAFIGSNKHWFDEECELWFEERSKARIISLQNKCVETHRKYIEICKNTSRFYRRKKREWEKNEILAIENHKKQNNTREMYRGINSIRKGFQSRTDVIRDENGNLVADATEGLNLWKNYFDKLLNVREAPAENNDYDDIHTAELQVDEPSDE
ncbi:craniofacial development protein 2-like, partial [Belonocnema kinseyi]|uniref:craniofacial development protein 2-like n=1 Tax=Belonocnema kinseyi TaxID=2817044 RepID=UPI00143D5FA7